MKRVGGLYGQIAEHDNLLHAFHAASLGKRDRRTVQAFALDLDRQIETLRTELLNERLVLRGYRFFTIHDPKPRRIAAPEFRDRVVHHALMRVMAPHLERIAIADSFACRKGKGLSAAVARAQAHSRRWSWHLQLDVRKFFDSVDHDTMLRLLQRRFKDAALLRCIARILASHETSAGKGLPIGALTSQHLANFYLAPLDRFVKETLRAPGYVRYMDDFVIFGPSASALAEWRPAIGRFLRQELALELKRPGAVSQCHQGVGFLGLLIRPSHVRLLGKSKRRLRNRLRSVIAMYTGGEIDGHSLAVRVTALLSRTHHVKSHGLRSRWREEFANVDA